VPSAVRFAFTFACQKDARRSQVRVPLGEVIQPAKGTVTSLSVASPSRPQQNRKQPEMTRGVEGRKGPLT